MRAHHVSELAREQRQPAYWAPATALAVNMRLYWAGSATEALDRGVADVEWLLGDIAAGKVFAAGPRRVTTRSLRARSLKRTRQWLCTRSGPFTPTSSDCFWPGTSRCCQASTSASPAVCSISRFWALRPGHRCGTIPLDTSKSRRHSAISHRRRSKSKRRRRCDARPRPRIGQFERRGHVRNPSAWGRMLYCKGAEDGGNET
jgi:hypothetical protein